MTIMDDILEFRTPKQLHALYVCLDEFVGRFNQASYNYESVPLLVDLQDVWCKKLGVISPKTLSNNFLQALLLSLLKREKAALKEEREVVNEIKQQIERLTI